MKNPLWIDIKQTTKQICFVMKKKNSCLISLSSHQKYLFFVGLRKWGFSITRTKRLCKSCPSIEILSVLSIAFALIEKKRYSNHTIVNQSVEATKKLVGKKPSSLVNYILRNTFEQDQKVIEDKFSNISLWNSPTWWINRVMDDYPKKYKSILGINSLPPPLTIRIVDCKKTQQSFIKEANCLGKKIFALGKTSFSVVPPFDICATSFFKEGLLSIQDVSAQKIIEIVKIKKGMNVLDACAAPGGKTFALASNFKSFNLISNDVSKVRIEKMKKDIVRQEKILNVLPKTVVSDITKMEGRNKMINLSPNGFDLIILDAPCSGSGVVRRHPEIPWKKSSKEMIALEKIQTELLVSCWKLLKNYGTLVYSTCSIFKREGEDQIKNFLKDNLDAVQIPSLGFILPSKGLGWSPILKRMNVKISEKDQNQLGCDGFYYAVLKKNNLN